MLWRTVDETEKLVKAALEVRPLTEEEMIQIYDWAVATRISNVTLGAILKGMIHVTVTDGEIEFHSPENKQKGFGNEQRSDREALPG